MIHRSLRILVAIDGSAASEAALGEAGRIADRDAEVDLLYVVPMLPFQVNATSAGVMAGHDQALTYLGELRARLPGLGGLNLIRTGDPADAILQVAQETRIDLIAMGAQVRSGLPGGVAETLLRRNSLPVLLRRPGLPASNKKLRRILVPLDGSEDSFGILATVLPLALRTGAEVVFLHLSEAALVPARVCEDPEGKLLRLADRLEEPDLDYWQTVAEGDPVEEILEHAATLDADLIALTTTIGGGAARAVLGRADRALLLQRPGTQAPKVWRYQ